MLRTQECPYSITDQFCLNIHTLSGSEKEIKVIFLTCLIFSLMDICPAFSRCGAIILKRIHCQFSN